MIDFNRAFSTAWERMMIILFRPFDLGKWFTIAVGAFLVGLLQGGNGYSGNGMGNVSDVFNKSKYDHNAPKVDFHEAWSKIRETFSGIEWGVIIGVSVAVIFFIICLSLLVQWLGARGHFILLDNIVRNRGEVSLPWSQYARQANGFFLLYLGFAFASLILTIPILVVAVVTVFPLIQHPHSPTSGEWATYAVLALAYIAVVIVTAIILFILREFCPPLMFRQGLTAKAALFEVVEVVKQNPGNVALIILLRIVLAIGMGIFSILVCCLSCCIGLLPFIGTVLILPGIIYIRCFTLDCIAQLGPRYDVWTVDLPVATPTTFSPFTPRPPLG